MKRMPIKAAEEVCKKYGVSQVILVAWDDKDGYTNVVTYGKDKKNCAQAAIGGKKMAAALGVNLESAE